MLRKIDLQLDHKLPSIFADKIQVKQILENVIQNSINAAKDDFLIKINTLHSNSNILITVIDNGIGIEQNDIKEIFKPYFTKSQGGTGLGLAIVRRIIENHGGNIDVNSQINVGTTFNILFPVVHKQEQI